MPDSETIQMIQDLQQQILALSNTMMSIAGALTQMNPQVGTELMGQVSGHLESAGTGMGNLGVAHGLALGQERQSEVDEQLRQKQVEEQREYERQLADEQRRRQLVEEYERKQQMEQETILSEGEEEEREPGIEESTPSVSDRVAYFESQSRETQ